MKLQIELFGGRGASSQKNNIAISFTNITIVKEKLGYIPQKIEVGPKRIDYEYDEKEKIIIEMQNMVKKALVNILIIGVE